MATHPAAAQGKPLTLCWAAWDPANALVDLGKDFTAKSGIQMKYEFVPWTSYADRFLNELNSHGKLCDLIIGDSQWIGGAAEQRAYVKLNDFFAKSKHHDGRLHAGDGARLFASGRRTRRTTGRCRRWPTPSAGPTARIGSRVRDPGRVQEKYGHDLAPPKTYEELKQVAEFFQGREIDGKKVYGAYIFTERGSEGITMGVTNSL